ncbi:MAG: formate dehydrogenase accessory sulfurtransferase FdhD [Longimicrobiales bacterium]
MRETAAVEERPFRLELCGRIHVWSWTPGRADALAAGWLLASGAIDGTADLVALELDVGRGRADRVRVQLTTEAEQRARAHSAHAALQGCGARHFLDCEPERLRGRAGGDSPPTRERLSELFGELYTRAARYQATGGLHTAALVLAGRIVEHAEDVGRHNAADIVIGGALLAGLPLGHCGLVISSRVSAGIALKAGRAGLAWLASRSVPTSLALELAGLSGLPLLARATGAQPKLFAPTPAAHAADA